MEGRAAGTGSEHGAAPRRRFARRRYGISLALIALLALAVAAAWLARERLADDWIERELTRRGIEATYTVERIGPRRQILTDIVVGDAARPDATVERIVVELVHRFGLPSVERITVIRPRLYGTWRDGRVSFGELDAFLYGDTGAPPGLPELDVRLVDGRARIATPWGAIGIKAAGSGPIDDGFTGVLAVAAPEIGTEECALDGGSLFGRLATDGGSIAFAGPLRFQRLACSGPAIGIGRTDLAINLRTPAGFESLAASANGHARQIAAGGVEAAESDVALAGSISDRGIALDYAFDGRRLVTEIAKAGAFELDGELRADAGFERFAASGDATFSSIDPGNAIATRLPEAGDAIAGTLAAPLLARLRRGLSRGLDGAGLQASYRLQTDRGGTTLAVPLARLSTRRGSALATISSARIAWRGEGPPQIALNATIGGPDLPRIELASIRADGRAFVVNVSMAPYAAGDASLAVPRLTLRQSGDGTVQLDGRAVLSGPIPGGSARNLRLPIEGSIDRRGRVRLWPRCTEIRFDALRLATLSLEARTQTLCPVAGDAILLAGGDRPTRFAAAARSLDLDGRLGGTAVRLRTGPVQARLSGPLRARDIDLRLGAPGRAARFRIADLSADLDGTLAGMFDDADIMLDAVPLDLSRTSGRWSYRDSALRLEDVELVVSDRAAAARFNPLIASDAALRLEGGQIAATALLRRPSMQTPVVALELTHDLSRGTGSADLAIPGIAFGDALQPVDLTPLALGVVANVEGVVRGDARLDWGPRALTSTGRFSSDDLDFAAAFGPVRGASGTIAFTDLLGLTTAPGQRVAVRSVNPGIEVTDGSVALNLRDGELLTVEGGHWPFLGGTLTLRRVPITLGAAEARRYTLDVRGLEAARFIERFELGNVAATGTFDGTLALVFDAKGNGRIEDGVLVSRAPGGSLSYIGELSYEDLGLVANFAFQSLRSLRFQRMRIAMDGPLAGQLVTRIRLDGVAQGPGAQSNILTREIAKLPLRFDININAPFYQLLNSLRSLYDAEYLRDPRELGLIDPAGLPGDAPSDDAVQNDESDEVP